MGGSQLQLDGLWRTLDLTNKADWSFVNGDWTQDIWGLAGGYPDNITSIGGLSVTLSAVNIFLDASVLIDGLRLVSAATLRVTQSGVGNLTINPASPGGLLTRGNLLVANDRAISVPGKVFTIGQSGKYVADPNATAPVSASLTAQTVRLLPTDCGAQDQLTLTDSMCARRTAGPGRNTVLRVPRWPAGRRTAPPAEPPGAGSRPPGREPHLRGPAP